MLPITVSLDSIQLIPAYGPGMWLFSFLFSNVIGGDIFCEKRLGKDHRIYWEKAHKTERQDIFQTLDEAKNHSHKLTVTFRTCLTILEEHFKMFNLILALIVIL